MGNRITTGSIFDDLGFSETESENLKIRAGLMRAIEKYIADHQLTQAAAANDKKHPACCRAYPRC